MVLHVIWGFLDKLRLRRKAGTKVPFSRPPVLPPFPGAAVASVLTVFRFVPDATAASGWFQPFQ